ncbi:unnamed protein product [Spirodela intermedia]|uniref:RING-type E3 ubiquitin transferase n=1 Tax=Spirodela intermedia TaxID=51605 RepID=A0A7I8LJZ3_SPIIN|nr:unnamed protein product [Spirodela intermedia]
MAEAAEEGGGGGGTRRLRRLLRQPRESGYAGQDRPLLIPPPARKDGFASAALLRGLGCSSAAAAQAYAPSSAAAVVRSSADWQAKPASCRRKKIKAPWKKARDRQRHPSSAHPRRNSAGGTELWCAPGVAFAASADDSVDCVVSQQPPMLPPAGSRGGRAADGDRIARERTCIERRGGRRLEQLSSFLNSLPDSTDELPNFRSDQMPSGHRRRLPNCRIPHGGLEEIMMLQSRLLLGGMDIYDQYQDLRLDVDNMSYEELLELGDKIGYVSTGLREEEIFQCLRKTRQSVFGGPPVGPNHRAVEKTCSICQEEYEAGDELGKLPCGHCYHMLCIRQWLLHKNACPVCKSAASTG